MNSLTCCMAIEGEDKAYIKAAPIVVEEEAEDDDVLGKEYSIEDLKYQNQLLANQILTKNSM